MRLLNPNVNIVRGRKFSIELKEENLASSFFNKIAFLI
jgi:hypothetical protein